MIARMRNRSNDSTPLVKIYTVDGTLARTMFIVGNAKATTSLPAGTYIIKDGTGKNWYGEEESFATLDEAISLGYVPCKNCNP